MSAAPADTPPLSTVHMLMVHGVGGSSVNSGVKDRTTIQASWYYHSMKTISLKLPDDIDAKLELRASVLGMTKSAITREALSRHLEGAPTPGVSCLDLVRDLVGTARGPGDLASNKKHLRGYGR